MANIDPVEFGKVVEGVKHTQLSTQRIEKCITKFVDKYDEDQDDIEDKIEKHAKRIVKIEQRHTFAKWLVGGIVASWGIIKGFFS